MGSALPAVSLLAPEAARLEASCLLLAGGPRAEARVLVSLPVRAESQKAGAQLNCLGRAESLWAHLPHRLAEAMPLVSQEEVTSALPHCVQMRG